MEWIDKIESIQTEYFCECFKSLNLTKYDEQNGPGMGALIKYKNSFFRLQILNDKGLLFTEISPIYGSEEFKDLNLLNAMLLLEIKTNVNGSERNKIIGNQLDYSNQAIFLLQNEEKLKTVLNKDNYQETLKKLDILGHERMGNLFKL